MSKTANDEPIELSPAIDEDYEFCFQVKKAAYGELIRNVFGWDEAVQRDFHDKEWLEKRRYIIRFAGVSIGTIVIIENGGDIEIRRFFIMPEYQGKGIGARVLQLVLAQADKSQTTVRLAYLKGNRAEALYRRNGFDLVRQNDIFGYMERKLAQTKSGLI